MGRPRKQDSEKYQIIGAKVHPHTYALIELIKAKHGWTRSEIIRRAIELLIKDEVQATRAEAA